MKKAAVLMPVYNAGDFLHEAIESVLNQTFSDFDLFILNDGSSDNSEEIILSYSDPRIIYVKNEQNIGLVNTLNKGIGMIQSQFIIRMDADDVSTSNRFELLVAAMEAHPEVGVLSSYLELFGDKTETWKMPLDNNEIKAGLIFNSTVAHAPCIIRTNLLKENKMQYSSAFPHMEDWDLWFRLMNYTVFKGIPHVLYRYRILEHNVTVVNSNSIMERRKNFYRRIFHELHWPATEKEIELHANLGKNEWSGLHTVSLREYKNWINKLNKLNNKQQVFPVEEFSRLLKSKRDTLFFRIADKGIAKAFNYWFVFGHVRFSHFRYLLAGAFKKRI